MKKIKESKKKKLNIKFSNITLTTKIGDSIKLKKGDHIKLQIGSKIEMYGLVTSDQVSSEKNVDKIEADEVENVSMSQVKEVFTI